MHITQIMCPLHIKKGGGGHLRVHHFSICWTFWGFLAILGPFWVFDIQREGVINILYMKLTRCHTMVEGRGCTHDLLVFIGQRYQLSCIHLCILV